MLKNLPTEWKIIRSIRDRFIQRSPEILVPIGDDGFVFQANREKIAITQDALVESVHFKRDTSTPLDLAHKIIGVNFSDLAAMGATPQYIFLSLALPSDIEPNWVENFFSELSALCKSYKVVLAGGDLTRSPGPIMIDLNAVGFCEGVPFKRTGIKEGDKLFVSGPIGLAGLGLKLLENQTLCLNFKTSKCLQAQLRPSPRTDQVPWLQRNSAKIHACIDISDGLVNETMLLLKDQRDLGSIIDLDEYLIHLKNQAPEVLQEMQQISDLTSRQLHQSILWGGEDYQLLCAISPDLAAEIAQQGWIPVGQITKGEEIYVKHNSQLNPILEYGGFQHFL